MISPLDTDYGDAHTGRLLVNVIEEKAHWTPCHTYMRYPPKNWEREGYRTITWSQYADAIDKVAHWLDAELGTMTENDTIAYSGPNDPRYAILVPATIKTGRKVGSIWSHVHAMCTLDGCN
jgi:acyl-CoA synthetase (AMP-forming)/AMP-acid ligase II